MKLAKMKLTIISIISAICCLGSIACFSAVAAETLNRPSGDDEYPAAVEPVAPTAPVEPTTPEPYVPADPTPEPYVPEEPIVSYEPEPYYESTPTTDPQEYQEPATSEYTYSATYSDVISEGNYPQPTVSYQTQSYTDYTTSYVDNSYQYNQYVYNTYQAQYDDNYIYIPEYEEPAESLVNTASKVIDTDELTNDDWHSIMLDLSNDNIKKSKGTQTFDFIKDNTEEGDSGMLWLVYAGVAMIFTSAFMVIFVIVSSVSRKP